MKEGTPVSRIGKINGLFLAAALTIGPAVFGQQEKPRVFIKGTGTVDVRTDGAAVGGGPWIAGASQTTVGSHNQTMELAKDFSKQCAGVIVTLNPTDADYAVELNHEAFHGLIFKNNQVMVTNRRGDLLTAQASHTVARSTNDSCAAILADWKANGRIEVPAPPPAQAPPAASAPEPAPQQQASAAPATPPPAAQPSMQVMDPQPVSLGEVSRRLKAQKENPPPPPQN
jgi:hypothetical protein